MELMLGLGLVYVCTQRVSPYLTKYNLKKGKKGGGAGGTGEVNVSIRCVRAFGMRTCSHSEHGAHVRQRPHVDWQDHNG